MARYLRAWWLTYERVGSNLICMSRATAETEAQPSSEEHPVLAALRRAPRVTRLTPEQRADLDVQVADIKAGRANLTAHEDVRAALEEMRRAEREG